MKIRSRITIVLCSFLLSSVGVLSLFTTPSNAWVPLGSHGTTGHLNGSVAIGGSTLSMSVVTNELFFTGSSSSGSSIHNICFTTSSFLPPNSYMNFTITFTGNIAGKFVGIPGNDRLQILDVDATYNGEGATYNITALSRSNNNNYWCLSTNSQVMWYNLPASYGLRVSSISWGAVLGGTGFVDDVASIKNQLQAIHSDQNEIKNSVNTIRDTLSNMSFPDPSGAIKDASDLAHKDSQAQLEEQKKQTEEQKKQTEAIEQTKDFVTDTSTPDSSDIANSDSVPGVGLLPDGPLDSLLLLPVNLLNSIIRSLGGTCSPISIPLPDYVGSSEKMTFPCMDSIIYSGKFAPLATVIGSVASGFILFYYLKHLYKKVDRATSLETTDEDEWGIL